MEEKLMVNEFEEATNEVVKGSKGKTGLVIGGLALAAGAAAFIGKKLLNKKKLHNVDCDVEEVEEENSDEESEE